MASLRETGCPALPLPPKGGQSPRRDDPVPATKEFSSYGAAFGIIPVVPAEAIPQGNGAASRDGAASVGRIAWLDLTVADASATCDFYRQVIGWAVQTVAMKDRDEHYADYTMLGRTEQARIG